MHLVLLTTAVLMVSAAGPAESEPGLTGAAAARHFEAFADSYFDLRRGLVNAGAVFTQTGKGRVAFLGGSITEMAGWRNHTQDELRRRFPNTEFDFVDAGIASTDSTLAAFRLASDVFGRGPVDLLFMDHAVNDHHNGRTSAERIRGVEGVIRHAHALNPNIDIVVQYFVEPYSMEYIERGAVAPEIADHDRVSRYYGVPAIDLALEVTERIQNGDFTWEQFRDLHPSPFGHEIYAARIASLFDSAWGDTTLADAAIVPHPVPDAPLDPFNYCRGRYVPLEKAQDITGWTRKQAWRPDDGAATRKQFVDIPMLEAPLPGAQLTLDFEGSAVGLLVVAGPDAGVLDYEIDGTPYPSRDLYTKWSDGLHLPWAYVLAADLAPGTHRLTVRTTPRPAGTAGGTACRVVTFFAN